MQKFISKEKLSKKEKRKFNLSQRKTWGAISPVTRKPENPKAYDRKKARQLDGDNYPNAEPLYVIL